ncbi:MAG: CAP domain-containing protein [Myxococcota bacterium]
MRTSWRWNLVLVAVTWATGCSSGSETPDNGETSSSTSSSSSSGATSSGGSGSSSTSSSPSSTSSSSSSTAQSSSSGGNNVCVSWTFSPGSVGGWSLDNALALDATQPGSGVGLLATGGDPFMSVQTTADLSTCRVVEVSMALSPSGFITQAQLFFARTTDIWFAEDRSRWFAVNTDGQLRTYTVDLSDHPQWNGTLSALRLDPFDAQGSLVLAEVRLLRAAGGSSSSSSSAVSSSSSSASSSSGAVSSSSSGGTVVPGEWPTLSVTEACNRFRAGRVVQDPNAFTEGPGGQCDPGTLSSMAIEDGLRRINLYRDMAGLGPVTDDETSNTNDQACALISAWNPAGVGAHSPSPQATCYSPEGAAGAGSSNIAWGCAHPADGVDQFMIDWGNESHYGHRRWIVYPPLDPVGIGFYRGGNNYGSAMCLGVFNWSNNGPRPRWYAFPPPGVVPREVAEWEWTFHTSAINYSGATVEVVRVSDNTALPTEAVILQGSYGDGALAVRRSGWTPQVGQTYRVTFTFLDETITYEHQVVECPP